MSALGWEIMKASMRTGARAIAAEIERRKQSKINNMIGQKPFTVANVRDIIDQRENEAISYSRMVEMLNEIAHAFYTKGEQIKKGSKWLSSAGFECTVFNVEDETVEYYFGEGARAEHTKAVSWFLKEFQAIPITQRHVVFVHNLPKQDQPRTPEAGDHWRHNGSNHGWEVIYQEGNWVSVKEPFNSEGPLNKWNLDAFWQGFTFGSSKADREKTIREQSEQPKNIDDLIDQNILHGSGVTVTPDEIAADISTKRDPETVSSRMAQVEKIRLEVEKMILDYNKKHYAFLSIDGFKHRKEDNRVVVDIELL